MRAIRPADWTHMAWHNGGGVTSEIAAKRQAGEIVWRMSTAVVDTDGKYSCFPNLTRISSAIEGAGTTLHDPDNSKTVEILPRTPTVLNGDIAWNGILTDGPIRHFNLIFDPRKVRASVVVAQLDGREALSDQSNALFCIDGQFAMQGHHFIKHDLALCPVGEICGKAIMLKIRLASINPALSRSRAQQK
jgi:environmental stress-induced protein Ves